MKLRYVENYIYYMHIWGTKEQMDYDKHTHWRLGVPCTFYDSRIAIFDLVVRVYILYGVEVFRIL